MATRWNQLCASTLARSHDQPESHLFPHHQGLKNIQIPRQPKLLAVLPTSTSGRELMESGRIQPVYPKKAASAVGFGGYVMLDVRPEWEREKARVSGSLHVPLFVEDRDSSPLTLLKKWVHFGYIGLWTGQCFTTLNPDFEKQVEMIVPDKEAKILVACGEGLRLTSATRRHMTLRSMIAASKLYAYGYRNLGWLAGGFNRSKDGDFPAVEGTEKLQYATVGGVSYYFLQLLILLQAVGKND